MFKSIEYLYSKEKYRYSTDFIICSQLLFEHVTVQNVDICKSFILHGCHAISENMERHVISY